MKRTKIETSKITNIFYKILIILLILLVGYVCYRSIFDIFQSQTDLKPIVIIIGTIVMIMFFIRLKKLILKLSAKQINIISIILCVVFFIGMSIFGNLLTSIPSTDLSNIIKECNIMIENGGKFISEGYFARYPNQTPITIFIYGIYEIGKFLNISTVNLNNFAIIINSLLIAVTAYFTYLSVKKINNEQWGLLTLIFFVINPIFYLYSSYFYTDTVCMPFASIAIYLYICAMKQNKNKKQILMLILSGLILALGFEIRVVLGILLIAMIISIILKKGKIKEKIKNSMLLTGGFIIGIILYMIISLPFGVLKNNDIEFPVTNWVMYGLNKESVGRWNSADFNLTLSQKTYEEKKEKNIEVIKKRLNDLGLSEWITLSKEKLAVNWSNGDYDYSSKLLNVEQINKLYEFCVGNKKIFLLYYLQICKVVLMLTLLIACINELKNKENNDSFIFISIFGAFAFYCIWEVLSRYSLTFLPWIIILFPTGIHILKKMLDIENLKLYFKDNTTIKVQTNKGIKILFDSVIIITIILGIVNFQKYVLKTQVYYDKIVMQAKSNESGIAKIGENVITQTFKADKKFNCIAIEFLKEDTKDVTHYYFTIKDSCDKELVKEEFNSDEVTNNSYKTFFFDYITPRENEEYTIQIYSEDATREESIGIATYYGYSNYDIYPNGILKINGEEIEQDITFKVQNRRERTYISKQLYIVIFMIIIGIEIFAFYPYIKK